MTATFESSLRHSMVIKCHDATVLQLIFVVTLILLQKWTEYGALNLADKTSTSVPVMLPTSFTANVNGETKNIRYNDVLFAPDLRTNLL